MRKKRQTEHKPKEKERMRKNWLMSGIKLGINDLNKVRKPPSHKSQTSHRSRVRSRIYMKVSSFSFFLSLLVEHVTVSLRPGQLRMFYERRSSLDSPHMHLTEPETGEEHYRPNGHALFLASHPLSQTREVTERVPDTVASAELVQDVQLFWREQPLHK